MNPAIAMTPASKATTPSVRHWNDAAEIASSGRKEAIRPEAGSAGSCMLPGGCAGGARLSKRAAYPPFGMWIRSG